METRARRALVPRVAPERETHPRAKSMLTLQRPTSPSSVSHSRMCSSPNAATLTCPSILPTRPAPQHPVCSVPLQLPSPLQVIVLAIHGIHGRYPSHRRRGSGKDYYGARTTLGAIVRRELWSALFLHDAQGRLERDILRITRYISPSRRRSPLLSFALFLHSPLRPASDFQTASPQLQPLLP